MSVSPLTQRSPTTPPVQSFIVNIIATENTMTSVGNNSNITTASYVLFGFPPFCSQSVAKNCQNITLNQCKDCSMVGAGLFCLAVVLLGLAIVTANLLVAWLFLTGKTTFNGSYGKIKMSLAVADFLTGVQLFFIVIPYFGFTINSTYRQIYERTIGLQNSTAAGAGGVFYLFIYTSSLYHLVFLALQRFCAIKWPISYQQQDDKHVYIGLAVVWVIAFICAISPTWFPNSLVFGYQHMIFLFNLSLPQQQQSANNIPILLVILFVFVLPFLLMNSLTVAAKFYMIKHEKKSASLRSNDNAKKRENMIFATMATMQMGFILTAMPIVVVLILSYCGALDNNTVSIPFVVCFYLSMSNSFVNVVIYSVMDEKFRKSVRNLFVNSPIRKFVAKHAGTTDSTEPKDEQIKSKSTPKSDHHPTTSV